MEVYFEKKAAELLAAFECAFSNQWEVAQEIKAYVNQHYAGDIERFIYDVSHSCDYFSIVPALKSFLK